jgi:hypothetical protein
MSVYTEFFLNSKSSVVQLELLEISHPNFSQTYYAVRNSINGVTVTLETAVTQFFTYYPMLITSIGSRDDLDQALKIDFGDLGELIPNEIDNITAADAFNIKPTVKYRTYSSNNLTQPLYGPIILEVGTFSFTREGASFEAKAPSLNINRTGELYSINDFPMLRGFL